jgi:hypothetical protein
MKKQLKKVFMATLSAWILNYQTAHSEENSISNYIYNAELISETSDIKFYVQSGTKSDCRNKDNLVPRFIVILKHDNISNRLAHNWNKEILETLESTHNEAKAFCPNVGNKTHIYTYFIENVLFQRDSNKIYILNNNPINTDYNDIINNASQDELEQIYKSDARNALELVTITQGGHYKPKINRSAHASISDQDEPDFNPDTFTAIDHSILGVAESFRQQNLAREEQERFKEWQHQNLAVDWPNSSD